MPQELPPLIPLPLETLLGRVAYEWETRKRIFDLPIARFYDVSAGRITKRLGMARKVARCGTPQPAR